MHLKKKKKSCTFTFGLSLFEMQKTKCCIEAVIKAKVLSAPLIKVGLFLIAAHFLTLDST